MPLQTLRVTSFVVYLASWFALAIVAILGALPRRGQNGGAAPVMTVSVVLGTILQTCSALPISLFLPDGPLRPVRLELIAALVLAPSAVLLFGWSQWSARKPRAGNMLITTGPYAWLRHPIYLAFLAMLIATGLLVSARLTLALATILYVIGSELRIRAEEADLERRFPTEYSEYRRNTPWAYVPGVR
jgi:protein-S-isoprenylcysteine O-methyltransferase Ste14